ncbi:cysteine desulfurase family protein [Thalassoroseus pseudoceratinae]|uniref:cysteine desulfurase family protein n=1 Tax=Thalassoroseus pseudoceratinae TaxID=2713176 RepID=UPI00141F8CD7|nr:cysteine desulfurase family protein [Thalassoroseus pseudoceratinae]
MTNLPIYLDNHATTRTDPRVVAAMSPFWTECFGNAGSGQHRFGQIAADAVEKARGQIADCLQVPSNEIYFTSGATEANNLALKGIFAGRSQGPTGHLIVSAAEHRAILDPAKRLRRNGVEVTILPVNEHGRVDPQQVADAIRPTTKLVSTIWANNEIGTWNDVATIGRLCRERGVWFHTDAVQAVGKIPIDLRSLPIDLMSCSAHKIYGPPGIGALIVRRGRRRIRLTPLLDGGGQEGGIRSGTVPVPLVIGFGEALRIAGEELPSEEVRIRELRDQLWTRLQTRCDSLILNGHPTERLAGNLNLSVLGVDGTALLAGLTDVAVSSGSACTTRDPEPSHVLRAIGRNDQLSRASLRIGIGRFNTIAEIDTAAEHIATVIEQLRDHKRKHTEHHATHD